MIQKKLEKPMEWDKATEYAKSLNLGGYRDWHLPTKDESEIIFKIRYICGIQFDGISFWSSETSDDGCAYNIWLHTGSFSLVPKKYYRNDVYCVR